jgi:phospholipid/cholesterol/gamma-HCH transport system substrate-binding protein
MANAHCASERSMEREANYAAVGAFVLLVLAMAGLFVYWYADSREHRQFTRYEVYFQGSVSGLTKGSTVRYLGVDVGRVQEMRIDSRSAARVQIVVDVDSSAPVSEKTVAELSLQGVTGLLYVDLLGRSDGKVLADPVPSERYPVIRSVRSGFDVFVSSLPDLVAKAGEVTQRLTLLLSDANLTSVTDALGNIAAASRSVPATMNQVDALVKDLRGTAGQMTAMAESLRRVSDDAQPDVKATIARVRQVAENMASTTTRLDRMLLDNQADVRGFTRDGLSQIEGLARDTRAAAQQFEALSRSLRDDPSQLLYQPAARGVEIPR